VSRQAAQGGDHRIALAELKKQFDSQDAVPAPTTPGEFAAFVKSEQAKWGRWWSRPAPSLSE
jgi:hypothetical protein